jgi:hypothetical protein
MPYFSAAMDIRVRSSRMIDLTPISVRNCSKMPPGNARIYGGVLLLPAS